MYVWMYKKNMYVYNYVGVNESMYVTMYICIKAYK